MIISYNYDINLDGYGIENHVGLAGTPISEVAQFLADWAGDSAELNSLKNTVLESLLEERTDNNEYELKLGAYRAIQLLALYGCDQLLKHMFSIDSSTLVNTRLPAVKPTSSLRSDAGSYSILYDKAKELLSKSSYFNKFQSPLHHNLEVTGSGLGGLLKLLALLMLYTDTN